MMSLSLKNILVPTDFSDCADTAAAAAIKLANHSGAKIHFLHLAIDQTGSGHVPGNVLVAETKKVRDARAKLYQLVRTAEAEGVQAKPELVLGTGAEHIENYLKPFNIDLLVMGSHGATGIREKIIGSHTQHVIRHCTIPSVVVKLEPARFPPKNMVYASTFKPEHDHALRQVVNFARYWDASLHLLFINSIEHPVEENQAHNRMEKEMEMIKDVRFTQNIADTNDIEFGIAQFTQQIDADMIAIAQEHRGVLDRIVHPGIADELINHSAVPVLVVSAEIV